MTKESRELVKEKVEVGRTATTKITGESSLDQILNIYARLKTIHSRLQADYEEQEKSLAWFKRTAHYHQEEKGRTESRPVPKLHENKEERKSSQKGNGTASEEVKIIEAGAEAETKAEQKAAW